MLFLQLNMIIGILFILLGSISSILPGLLTQKNTKLDANNTDSSKLDTNNI